MQTPPRKRPGTFERDQVSRPPAPAQSAQRGAGQAPGRQSPSGIQGPEATPSFGTGLLDVAGPLKAMTPGVVDYLFRQLVTGESGEDLPWQREGITLSAQPAGAELARRLAETDVEALTPVELFHYVRAAQRLASWAEGLREAAVERYCGGSS